MTVLQHFVSGKLFKPPRIIVYGPEKIGKTSFAAEMPRPILIATEDGANRIDVDKTPKVEHYSELILYLTGILEEEHKYKTLILDSLDWAERLIHQKVAEDNGVDDIEKIGYSRGYKHALKYWADVLNLIDQIMAVRKMAFCGIAHSVVKEFKNPDGENFDRFSMNLYDGKNSSSVETLKQWCDAILFINFKVFTKVATNSDPKKPKHKAIDADRVIYSQSRPMFVAGNRYGLPDEIPLVLGETWNSMAGYFKSKKDDKIVTKAEVATDPKPVAAVLVSPEAIEAMAASEEPEAKVAGKRGRKPKMMEVNPEFDADEIPGA